MRRGRLRISNHILRGGKDVALRATARILCRPPNYLRERASFERGRPIVSCEYLKVSLPLRHHPVFLRGQCASSRIVLVACMRLHRSGGLRALTTDVHIELIDVLKVTAVLTNQDDAF